LHKIFFGVWVGPQRLVDEAQVKTDLPLKNRRLPLCRPFIIKKAETAFGKIECKYRAIDITAQDWDGGSIGIPSGKWVVGISMRLFITNRVVGLICWD
jgi:hypothetical protein